MDGSLDRPTLSLHVETIEKHDLELDDIVKNAEKNLKSEVVKANEKRRSQLIVLGSSSESSMKSIDFGSATLSSINNSMSGSNIQSCPEDGNVVQDLNPTLLDDVDISSLADISEELISISNNSSISMKFIKEKLAMKSIEKCISKSSILNSTIEINSELLSSEANRIISSIEAKNHSELHFKNESLEVLDLGKPEDKLSSSASFIADFNELQDAIVAQCDHNTISQILEYSMSDNVLMLEAQKVIGAVHADYLNSCQNCCIDDYEILDLELQHESFITSPKKGCAPKSDKIDANNTTPQMSTPVLTKVDREKLFRNFCQILRGTEGRLKDFKIYSPFCDANPVECETYQNATFNMHNCKVDPTSQLPNLNCTFDDKSRQDICNTNKYVNSTFECKNKIDDTHNLVTNLNFTFEKKSALESLKVKNQANTTFNQTENLPSCANNDKAKLVDRTFLHTVVPINSTFDHNEFNEFKDEEIETVHNGTFNADNKEANLNNTFEIVGNGNFIIEGEVTNLIDMESTALETVLHCTPVQAVKVEQGVTPVYRRNSSCTGMKKQSFMNRLSLAGAVPSCSKELLSVQNPVFQSEPCNKLDQQQTSSNEFCPLLKTDVPLCKDNLLNKLRKNTKITSGYSGPVKAMPFKAVSECERLENLRKRAISTPKGVKTLNGSGSSISEKKDMKFPSLPSFGSVSSIDERPNTFDSISDGTLGTPEVFRRQISRDGPAITSTPAMNSEKYSMIPKGLCESNVPTPIVAPKEMRNIKEVMNIYRCSSSDPYLQDGISTDQELEFEKAYHEHHQYPCASYKKDMEGKQLSSHTYSTNEKKHSESEEEQLEKGNNCVQSNQIQNKSIEELASDLDEKTNENCTDDKHKITKSNFNNQCDPGNVKEVRKIEHLETIDKCIQRPFTQDIDKAKTSHMKGLNNPSDAKQSNRLSLLNGTDIACDIDKHKVTKSPNLNPRGDTILGLEHASKNSYAVTDSVAKTRLERVKMASDSMEYNGNTYLETRPDLIITADEHTLINSPVANSVKVISGPLENDSENHTNDDCPFIHNVKIISETEEIIGNNSNFPSNRKVTSNYTTVKKRHVASNPIKGKVPNAGIIGSQPSHKQHIAQPHVNGSQLIKATPMISNSAPRRISSAYQKFTKPILSIKNQEATSRAMLPGKVTGNKNKDTPFTSQKSTIAHKKSKEIQSTKLKSTISGDAALIEASSISLRPHLKKELTTGLKVPLKVSTVNPLQYKSVNSTSTIPKTSVLKFKGQNADGNAARVLADCKFNIDKTGGLGKTLNSNKENISLLPQIIRPSGIRRPASNIPRMNFKRHNDI